MSNTLNIQGIKKINEDLELENIKVSGIATFNGKVKCDCLNISGKAVFNNEIIVDTLKLTGTMNAITIKADTIRITGILNAFEISADNLVVNGIIKVTNKIKADNIKIATKIEDGPNIFPSVQSSIDKMEADHINVSNIKCRLLKGNNVIVNTNSEIECIEYRDSLTINRYAKVNLIRKVEEQDEN